MSVLSAAYVPALRAILATLTQEHDGGLAPWLRGAGAALTRQQLPSVQHPDTIDSALELLRALGAVVSSQRDGHAHIIRSTRCALGAATRAVPEICKLLEGAVGATLPSHSVREHCDRGERSRCASG